MVSRPSLPFVSSRQAEIIEIVARNGWGYFRNQLSLNPKPEEFSLPLPGVLRQILIELGPTFVKLGQLLSTRPDLLGPEYIIALETLQSDVPGLEWSTIEAILEEELGEELSQFVEIDPVAIAAGSLGQVHRGSLKDGTVIAIKVQRPGIRRTIEKDLSGLKAIAELLDSGSSIGGSSIGRAYDLPGLVEEFRNSLMDELDFRREASNTQQLSKNLSDSSIWKAGQVCVPKVYEHLSTERVLTLEWIEGVKLNDAAIDKAGKQEVAALATQVMMQQMFLNRFFHADPHPGNFLYMGQDKDGHHRIALLDCGMVAMLDPRTQRIITDLVVGVVYEQPRQVAQAVRELGFARLEVDIRALEAEFDRLLRRFYTRPLEAINLTDLLNEALRIPREKQIQMPGTVGLFVKAIANVEGIARQLDPQFSFVEVARPVVEKSLQQRVLSTQGGAELARSSLYLSQLALDLPQRVNVLLDRLERSELGLNWRWKGQEDFEKVVRRGLKQLSLGIIGVGCLLSGSILMASFPTELGAVPPRSLFFWSQGLLVTGAGVNLWLILKLLRS